MTLVKTTSTSLSALMDVIKEGPPLYVGLAGLITGAASVVVAQKVVKALRKPKNVRVTYFKFSGRAGATRAALQLAKIKYENLYVTKETLQPLKPKLPFGQVPVFEMNDKDGEMTSQSEAFLRFVGKFADLYPSDPYKALKVDEMLGAVQDISGLLRPSFMESSPEKKIKMRKDLIAEDGSLRVFMEKLQKVIISNGGPYSCGSKLSIADLSLYTFINLLEIGWVEGISGSFINDFPFIQQIYLELKTMKCWDMEYPNTPQV